jgi:guanylate kinase
MMGKCLIFSAPSGSGKTTIVHYLLGKSELHLEFSVSATSRAPRQGEKDGVDYYYLSKEQFREKADKGDFVEWEEVYEGLFYGTLKKEIERIWEKGSHVVFDVDVKGGINLKKIFGQNALLVFVMPPSIEELEKRLRKRSTDDEAVIKKRIAKAETELAFAPQFDVQLVNDSLDKALDEAYKLVSDFIA